VSTVSVSIWKQSQLTPHRHERCHRGGAAQDMEGCSELGGEDTTHRMTDHVDGKVRVEHDVVDKPVKMCAECERFPTARPRRFAIPAVPHAKRVKCIEPGARKAGVLCCEYVMAVQVRSKA
jgi:hypothetical protein